MISYAVIFLYIAVALGEYTSIKRVWVGLLIISNAVFFFSDILDLLFFASIVWFLCIYNMDFEGLYFNTLSTHWKYKTFWSRNGQKYLNIYIVYGCHTIILKLQLKPSS